MFVDRIRVRAQAGDGGNGCVSFRREKYIDRGGPDGGTGGKGGDIVLVADKNVQDLSDLYYRPRLVAKRGGHGRGKNCTGRNAPDVVVRVPVGTQVYRLGAPTRQRRASGYRPAAAGAQGEEVLREVATAEQEQSVPAARERELVADLVEDGQRYVLAHGGRGGRGNASFKSSTHQAPREFQYGQPGETVGAELELKTLADVGLVGYPNAGKSTLISRITQAHPKIAPYPFTTLTPNVGVLAYEDYSRVRIADIPGLIEGAHEGRGLGHEFLRHIERCRLLVILLDMAGVDARDPWDDYRRLLAELQAHDPALLGKPQLLVANKMDLPAAKKNLAAFKRKLARASRSSKPRSVRAMPSPSLLQISALAGSGLDEFKRALRVALGG
jgi:GTP-binding protein